jgi:RHS repeat-associated protein
MPRTRFPNRASGIHDTAELSRTHVQDGFSCPPSQSEGLGPPSQVHSSWSIGHHDVGPPERILLCRHPAGGAGRPLSAVDSTGPINYATAEYIFFGGQRLAMLPAGSTPQYYVEDMLGSSRIVTTNTGVVCYDADFTPFGAERTITNTCAQNKYKFEGKERDDETGNDDFGARYYTWRFGRWLSSDWSAVPVPVPYANFTNPQTLNLYAMVSDDPESFADLDGHCPGINPSCIQVGQLVDNNPSPCLSNPGGNTLCPSAGQILVGVTQDTSPMMTDSMWAAMYAAPSQAPQQGAQGPTYQEPGNLQEAALSNVIYNETSSLRANDKAKPGETGSAEDLHSGRVAVGEVANRVLNSDHPERVQVTSDLKDEARRNIIAGNADAINAHNDSLAAARQALAGSNTTNGATLYRIRHGTNIHTPVGNRPHHPGSPVSMHFGPFPDTLRRHNGPSVIVVAP